MKELKLTIQERYDELTANPDGIEPFKDEVVPPEVFAVVFQKAMQEIIRTMELGAQKPHRSTYHDALKTEPFTLYHLQKNHSYTWEQLQELIIEWRRIQLAKASTVQHISRVATSLGRTSRN